MQPMPLAPDWQDFLIRLAVALVTGATIGWNRGESGKAAGLRTTMLVCLAACIAMLQVNVLLPQAGKPENSFVVLDLMRLPLGILSGVGFIGAGAILRKDGFIVGLTTAATLWFVTVIGLCAGGGQIALAVAGTALGLIVLEVLGVLERRLPRAHRAWLTVEYTAASRERGDLIARLEQQRCNVDSKGVRMNAGNGLLEERFEIRWRAPPTNHAVEHALSALVNASSHDAAWSVDA
ncbi:MgtC/SapB family protein [Paraburkholderia megapolitana]|uniref:MgtC/SapB family protein n=1 Tax=Paraburkholderia megapolitana TaxID=420953 RepID=UPI0038B7D985